MHSKMFLVIIITLWFIGFAECQSPPAIFLKKFYVPGLDIGSNESQGINTTTISVELSFWRLNNKGREQPKSVYYDSINLAVYYYSDSSDLPIGNISIPEFHHSSGLAAHRSGTVMTLGVPWEKARTEVSSGKTIMFRIELDTKTRYSNGILKSKRHDLRLGTNVTVNDRGSMSFNHDLRLSSAPVQVGGLISLGIVALSVLVLHILL
ncbi:uncharacterized protein LOC113355058 [Papaver somniferum]|uniref:uncharacterized protein LOC113355058 n=1 Tax=Papaver somniferum TaxID=3469 RepID=UPI000E6FF743|nr:uncharacterized protein LOC113355058 [Papaver somniferum]